MAAHTATNPVRTAEMTINVIEGLEECEGATLTELAAFLGEPKSTVHNHLSTLLEHNYLVKEENVYFLGLRFTELGDLSKNKHKVNDISSTEVQRLASRTGELANLAVEEHGYLVYLHRSRGEDAITTDTFSGKRVHLHCTALGKAMMAFLPDEEIDDVISRFGLPKRTDNTITDRERLLAELENVRDQGVAYDDEERARGIRCVAAPIMNQGAEQPVASLSVSAPANRMKEKRFTEKIPEMLRGTVNVIEIELAHSEI